MNGTLVKRMLACALGASLAFATAPASAGPSIAQTLRAISTRSTSLPPASTWLSVSVNVAGSRRRQSSAVTPAFIGHVRLISASSAVSSLRHADHATHTPPRPSAAQSAAAIAPVVLAMIVGLPAFGNWSLYQRVFYAYEDSRAMVPVQIVMAAVVAARS